MPAEVTDLTIDEPNRNGFLSASVVLLDVISERQLARLSLLSVFILELSQK